MATPAHGEFGEQRPTTAHEDSGMKTDQRGRLNDREADLAGARGGRTGVSPLRCGTRFDMTIAARQRTRRDAGALMRCCR